MRREQYWPDKDPVSRRIGDDVLGRALRKVLRDSERWLLLDYLHGAPLVQMARQFGWTVAGLQELIRSLLIRLRDSEFGPQLREELLGRTGPQHSALVWEGVKEVPVHRCQRVGCTTPPFVQKARGRTRKYCSDACKQAAYRSARAEQPAKRAAAPTALSNPWFRVVRSRKGRRMPYRFLDYTETDAVFPDTQDAKRAMPESSAYGEYFRWKLAEWMPSRGQPKVLGTQGVGAKAAWGKRNIGLWLLDGSGRMRALRDLRTVVPARDLRRMAQSDSSAWPDLAALDSLLSKRGGRCMRGSARGAAPFERRRAPTVPSGLSATRES
ncbi:hypothetical protein [Streptomyces sp. TLI_185]|uniref:hypothetical protein n=1 Tax=Streptomyces sp. TLI_185 TaxID=2485151 RepID=UPI000F4D3929|nr:hypothetical protein [Streptomyces sp. TLI_185]RPF39249.1 hypothetical protein EDD92_9478 [Streptomyces sp. TLI_185]